MLSDDLDSLVGRVRACALCADQLPLGPRPVVQLAPTARLLIISQAPGTKVHATGIPFNDPSGDTLRRWLGVDRATFYDASRVAIMPMGFCYPGRGTGGDLPPIPLCSRTWHRAILALLPEIRLTLLVGSYSQAAYLGDRRGRTLADTVARWREFLPSHLPTPHPSPRNRRWLAQNPWFEAEVVPELARRVGELAG